MIQVQLLDALDSWENSASVTLFVEAALTFAVPVLVAFTLRPHQKKEVKLDLEQLDEDKKEDELKELTNENAHVSQKTRCSNMSPWKTVLQDTVIWRCAFI